MTDNRFTKYFRKYAVFIFIFIFCLTFRLVTVSQKDGLFIDEPYTYVCATPNNLSPEGVVLKNNYKDYNFEYGKNYTAAEVKKALFSNESSLKSIAKDLKKLRKDNIDRPHTNLYYSIYRIISAGVSGLDVKELYLRGYVFNIFLFILEFFFMYKLLSLISRNTTFKAFCLLFSLLSVGCVSNSLPTRGYALTECFFVGTNYVFLSLLLSDRILKFKKLLGYSLITAVFILSSYLSLIYAGFVFFILISYSLFKKKINVIKNTILITGSSLFIVLAVYPSFFDFSYKNEHYDGIIKRLQFINPNQLSFAETNKIVWGFLVKYLFYKPLLYCAGLFYIIEKLYEKIKALFKPINTNKDCSKNLFGNEHLILIISVLSLIWAYISIYISPYSNERFVLPAFPIISLLLVVVINHLKSNILRYLLVGVFLFCSCKVLFLELRGYNNDFCFLHSGILYEFNENDKYVFHMGESAFFYPNYYILIPDNAVIRMEKEIPSKNFDLKSYKLITDLDNLTISDDKTVDLWYYIYAIDNKDK